jgi:hypothetical protein
MPSELPAPHARRFFAVLLAVAFLATLMPAPAFTASGPSPSGATATETSSAASVAFSMNLYRAGDFVTQYTKEWCVAAALQIMLNISGRLDDRSMKKQVELFSLALGQSRNHGRMTTERGWAATLNKLGVGPYEVRSTKTRVQAIQMAAEAIRRTNRPAGLLTWWGAHSWVMHGFTATADPRQAADFRVTAVYVSDPWYPKVSSIWGPSLPPNSRMTVEGLHIDYIPWIARAGRTTEYSGKYVLIVPIERRPAPKRAAPAEPWLPEAPMRPARWTSFWHDASGRWLS